MQHQTTTTWEALRAWLEEPAPGVPDLSRLNTYCLKRILRAVGASSSVDKFLWRQKHRGKDAQAPPQLQLAKVLPIFTGASFQPAGH